MQSGFLVTAQKKYLGYMRTLKEKWSSADRTELVTEKTMEKIQGIKQKILFPELLVAAIATVAAVADDRCCARGSLIRVYCHSFRVLFKTKI